MFTLCFAVQIITYLIKRVNTVLVPHARNFVSFLARIRGIYVKNSTSRKNSHQDRTERDTPRGARKSARRQTAPPSHRKQANSKKRSAVHFSIRFCETLIFTVWILVRYLHLLNIIIYIFRYFAFYLMNPLLHRASRVQALPQHFPQS